MANNLVMILIIAVFAGVWLLRLIPVFLVIAGLLKDIVLGFFSKSEGSRLFSHEGETKAKHPDVHKSALIDD